MSTTITETENSCSGALPRGLQSVFPKSSGSQHRCPKLYLITAIFNDQDFQQCFILGKYGVDVVFTQKWLANITNNHKETAHCKNLPHISTKKNQVQLGCTSYFELNYI